MKEYPPPVCQTCGSTRTRLDPTSNPSEHIDTKLQAPEYYGLVTTCPDCGTQGIVSAAECKLCGQIFEWIVTAKSSRPADYCNSPECIAALVKYTQARRLEMRLGRRGA